MSWWKFWKGDADVKTARSELDAALENRPKVDRMTKEMHARGRRNHFAEALQIEFEKRSRDQP